MIILVFSETFNEMAFNYVSVSMCVNSDSEDDIKSFINRRMSLTTRAFFFFLHPRSDGSLDRIGRVFCSVDMQTHFNNRVRKSMARRHNA